MSTGEARVAGIALGLIVGLVLVFWLAMLFRPMLQGTGTRGMAAVSGNLTAMLATAAGGRWATEPLFKSADYSRIVAPYILTVAVLFVGIGFFFLIVLIMRMFGQKPAT
jgi:hypothetical protein